MDRRRLRMLQNMGMDYWQLTRPSLIASSAPARRRQLCCLGPQPSWLADLCDWLELERQDVRDWKPGEAVSADDWLLLTQAEPGADLPAFTVCLDATAGKRSLWLQVCAAGLGREWSHD